jgi:TM2 domain-containing membrane protein YozV
MNAENKTNNKHQERLIVSYVLNAVGFAGLAGLHRLYNGKIGTGLLWLCTGGVLGIGQFVDLFLIPNMVEEQELKLRQKAGVSPLGVPLNQSVVASKVHNPPSGNELMIKLLKEAQTRGGSLTVTQGVIATGASFTEVETILKEMMKSGYAKIDNDPVTGAVTYYFQELS